jgi:hypothetical protein
MLGKRALRGITHWYQLYTVRKRFVLSNVVLFGNFSEATFREAGVTTSVLDQFYTFLDITAKI